MTAAGTAAHKAKGAIQYRRLTPLGGTGLSALGLGLSSPASAAPPNRDSAPSYAAVVANAAAGFAVDFDDAPRLPRGALAAAAPEPPLPAKDRTSDGQISSHLVNDVPVAPPLDPDGAPVWCPPGASARLRALRSPMLRLHAEIVDFCRFLEPTAAEREAREGSVARVRAAVLAIWPGARFEVHGSFATGMYLPNSDVDAVILDSGAKAPATCLKALALSLSRKGMATDIQLIAKARVPIVKFIEKQSGFQFDISFDVANGPASAEIVRANTRRFPALRPLVTVLKAFLQQRALNEVYSGGIGSYALLCMVMAHLQLHDTKATASAWAGESGGKAAEEGCLGALLIDFFELYGRRVNTDEVGVSCRGGGRFFAKRDKSPSWAEPGRPFLFSIEDPQDPSNDLGRNSYAARSVKAAFEHAFTLLTAPAAKKDEFLLGRVVRADPETLRRRTPPPAAGAIVGVAADFARYAFAQPGDGPVGGGGRGTPAEHAARGRKRKAAETPARPDDASSSASSSSSSSSSSSAAADDTSGDEHDASGSDAPDDDADGGSSSSSSSSSGSEEEGQVARRPNKGRGRGGRGGRGGGGGRAGGRGARGRGDPKTPANKRRKTREGGGGRGYFAKGRPNRS